MLIKLQHDVLSVTHLRRSMRPSPSQARLAGGSPGLLGLGLGLPQVPSASACACRRHTMS